MTLHYTSSLPSSLPPSKSSSVRLSARYPALLLQLLLFFFTFSSVELRGGRRRWMMDASNTTLIKTRLMTGSFAWWRHPMTSNILRSLWLWLICIANIVKVVRASFKAIQPFIYPSIMKGQRNYFFPLSVIKVFFALRRNIFIFFLLNNSFSKSVRTSYKICLKEHKFVTDSIWKSPKATQ